MLIYSYENFSEPDKTPCVFLLGGFDGLHKGHLTLLSEAKKYRLPIGITSLDGCKGESLFTPIERREIFAAQGIALMEEFAFTDALKNMSPQAFLDTLTSRFDIRAFICGEDFRFGKGAAGDPAFVAEYANRPVKVRALLKIGGRKISTATIKEYVENGEIGKANELLLTPFFLRGKVAEGRREGGQIGFPTANVYYPKGKVRLKEGVYASRVVVDGKEYDGITNFGPCPTFGVEEKKTETYLDGFSGNLYGREIDITITKYLRGVIKFSSAEELKEQLTRDMRRAKEERGL